MFVLYTANTPNGIKPVIMMEECGLDYRMVRVDLNSEDQKDRAFREINPNGKVPALVDETRSPAFNTENVRGQRIFESGAILLHLAAVSGKFLPTNEMRGEALSWLFWQPANLGPMLGQFGHFAQREGEEYARQRFLTESIRLFDMLEEQLSKNDYLAGEYSIADMMSWKWAQGGLGFLKKLASKEIGPYPSLNRWVNEIAARPAVLCAETRMS